ncbi:MAG: hypothetical protein IH914_08305, partial [candidate division Zixibacteria bacterium]|nr:hypothetical protein [candidate division Zixibacteria bacterium]
MTLLNIMSPLKGNFRLRSILGGLCILIVSASAYSSQSGSDWNSNSEARTRLLTPFGLEADGRTLWIGLEIQLEDGWHSYWKNPGDAGLPPEFTISDSGIIEALEINFTPPKFYPFGGGLDANGYADEVVYPIKLTLSESAASQTEVDLELGMFYLVCKHLCIPHDEEFKLLVSLTNSSSAENSGGNTARKLKAALGLLPKVPADVPGYSVSERLTRDGDDYLLSIKVNLAEQSQEFPEIFFHATPDFKLGQSSFQVGESRTEIIIQVPIRTKVAGKKITKADFGYLLTKIKSGEKYISIEKEVHLAVSDGVPFGDPVRVGATASVSNSGDAMPLWKVILFALLGGLILNIMPCVLPVLSIKLMGVVQHSGESHGKIARGMLASSAGITTSFLALALAAVIAKSAGAAVGWGVQFQEPIFVTFLAVIVFLFGLNLWGVFEVTLPSSVSSGAARSASGRGHFVQGMFATLLATPCSAPFLGTAVSFALSSPGWIIYLVFASMGI